MNYVFIRLVYNFLCVCVCARAVIKCDGEGVKKLINSDRSLFVCRF